MTDEQLYRDLLNRYGHRNVKVDIALVGITIIIAQIQLALRHPGNHGPGARAAEQIARDLQAALAQVDPELDRFLEKGWHPEFDVEVGGV